MHSLFAHWAADLPGWCQDLCYYNGGRLLGWFCASFNVLQLQTSSRLRGALISAWLTHKMIDSQQRHNFQSTSNWISQIRPSFLFCSFLHTRQYPRTYVALMIHNYSSPLKGLVLPLYSFMVEVIRPSIPVLSLKMCCMFSMKREDEMAAL